MDIYGIAIIAAGVILFAAISNRLRDTVLTPPMIFAGFGLLIGSAVFGLVDLDVEHEFIHGLAEVTLILVLFSDAARIDLRQVRRDHNLPVRLLLVGLPLIVIAGTAVAFALPLGLTFWQAALLAAILAPTDAALGQSVVSSPRVPARIRQALNIESGLNDGIALPLVLFFACLASAVGGESEAQNWLVFGAKQIGLGPLAGVAIGLVGARLIDRAAARNWLTESFEGLAILALALLAFAGAEIIGGNGFIAAFVSGVVFGNQVRGRCGFIFEFVEAEGQLLTLSTFLVFGAVLLPTVVDHLGWATLLYAVLSLTAIRLLPVAISLFGAGVRAPTLFFLGWFGPRGLASILFALLILEEAAVPAADEIMAVTIVTVALSILAHGITAAPAARWYGAKMTALGSGGEHQPVSEMPTRAKMTKPEIA